MKDVKLPKMALRDLIALPFDVDFARAEDNETLLKKFYRQSGDKITIYTRDYACDQFWHHTDVCLSSFIEKHGYNSQWYML